MTVTCSCPPGDCHGGHTINVGPARLTGDRLRQLRDDPNVCTTASERSMAAELLSLRDYVTDHEGRCNTLCPRCGVDIGLERCEACGRPRFSDRHLAQVTRERDEARADAGDAHGKEGSLRVRVMELRAQVTARDKRIAELEAEAQADEREIEEARDERDEARARVAELEADSIDRDFGIQAMSIAPGESTLSTKPTTERARQLVLAMSLACGRMLDEDQAPNYVEFEVSPAGHPGYVVHVRRAEGRSPHTLRRDAEARAERAEARVAELEAAHARLVEDTASTVRRFSAALDGRDAARQQCTLLLDAIHEHGGTVTTEEGRVVAVAMPAQQEVP